MATQHSTLEPVKYWGSPRISQMPWSGSPASLMASSTKLGLDSRSHLGRQAEIAAGVHHGQLPLAPASAIASGGGQAE
jgi:hypothetical protein